MPAEPMPCSLTHAQAENAWISKTHPEIQALAKADAIPILPVAALCRWQKDWPLDSEEILLGHLLQSVSSPVLPPFRHCPRQDPRQAFTVSSTTAWQALHELILSVHQSGFQKCIFIHANPYLADWLDCGLRDLRIETGMGLYRIACESLGFQLEDPGQRAELSPLIFQGDCALPAFEKASAGLPPLLEAVANHPVPPLLRP